MLDFMKTSQLAALILGIVFAVISVATTFLAIKYAKRINSFAKGLTLSLIAPFISCIAWMYLIFSFIDGLRKNEVLALVIAVLLSIFVFGMIVVVAKALDNKYSAIYEEYDKLQEEGILEEDKIENDENEVTTEEAKVVAPLLLEHAEDDNVEEIIVDSENTALLADVENTELEEESTEEIEDEEVEDEEEIAEEAEEESTEEAVSEEPEEYTEEIEETDIEETETDETNVEEAEETETEEVEDEATENVEENVEETDIEDVEEQPAEDVEESESEETDDDDDDDSDEENFEKFLEDLKKKVEEDNGEGDK